MSHGWEGDQGERRIRDCENRTNVRLVASDILLTGKYGTMNPSFRLRAIGSWLASADDICLSIRPLTNGRGMGCPSNRCAPFFLPTCRASPPPPPPTPTPRDPQPPPFLVCHATCCLPACLPASLRACVRACVPAC